YTKSSIHLAKNQKDCSWAKLVRVHIFVEDSWNEKPCSDVHQVGDEREVEVLCAASTALQLN
ncbi:hypothetical protein Tco_0434173, partial [Tanacetum coccineum]